MLRDPRFERFEVLPMTGALGAEIRGVDLGSDPEDAVFADVKRALDHFHVLAVRDQSLDAAKLHRVARRFGPFSGNPVHAGIEGFDDIVRFVREKDDTGKVIGEDWHMDLAWMERPPGTTMLYGEEVPPVGGDTCFSSLEHAYRALSPRMRELLGGLTGVFSGRGVFAENAAHKGLALRTGGIAVEDLEREHPIICRHPVTGTRYVFVASTLSRFKGMTEAESRPIIDYLMKLATRPEFNCRLRWAKGTLGMWANPYVLHTAINDYPGYRREMYRTTVEGVPPLAALPEPQETPVSQAA
ncbi:TauD/TfdA dioxygenase family protein [Roseomonas sp. BN140053]|uniref:TauD/TfdA dioxygenase family protein n=1 Tax=Roseomonas sp. BN140053 TaxID=3391898 RepID=UPI0039EB831F